MKLRILAGFVAVFCLSALWACAADEGRPLTEKTCTVCHDLVRIESAIGVKDKQAWTATVTRMLSKPGAPAATPEERAAIIDWLAGQKK